MTAVSTAREANGTVARPLPFSPPFLLAPMEGLTSRPFRAVVEDLGGVGAVFTEFVSEQAAISRKVCRREVRRGRAPLIVQLLGNDAERLARSVDGMVEAGADGIDLNVGCPSSCVTKGLRGAALLKDLGLLGRLLRAMVAAADGAVPVSAKVRAGWNEDGDLERIARVVEDAGCAFLTVHGRTFAQGYTGRASLDRIALAREQVAIPVVANGDVRTAEAALRIVRDGVADGAMIGRAAVRNPWIFSEITALARGERPPQRTAACVADMLGRFEASFLEGFGQKKERAVLAKLKEIVNFLAAAVDDGGAFTRSARRAQSLGAFHEAVTAHLRPLPLHRLHLDA